MRMPEKPPSFDFLWSQVIKKTEGPNGVDKVINGIDRINKILNMDAESAAKGK